MIAVLDLNELHRYADTVARHPDAALKLDMFARISIPTSARRSAVAVPIDAVQTIDDKHVVFVRQSATRFERRFVQTGTTAGNLTEVTSGVKPGEAVAITASGANNMARASMRRRTFKVRKRCLLTSVG